VTQRLVARSRRACPERSRGNPESAYLTHASRSFSTTEARTWRTRTVSPWVREQQLLASCYGMEPLTYIFGARLTIQPGEAQSAFPHLKSRLQLGKLAKKGKVKTGVSFWELRGSTLRSMIFYNSLKDVRLLAQTVHQPSGICP
jgi:hypothetical protein